MLEIGPEGGEPSAAFAGMVFLDDVERHVAAARALGIHGLLFKETAQAIAGIEACLRDQSA